MSLTRPRFRHLLLVALACAAFVVSRANAGESRASGEINLQDVTAQFKAPVVARLGNELQAPIYAGVIDYLGTNAISFGPMVHNPTQRPMYYAFYFALFDREGRLVAAGGNWKNKTVVPKEYDSALCTVVEVPRGTERTVARFEAVFYESPGPVEEAEFPAGVVRAAPANRPKDADLMAGRVKVTLSSFRGAHEDAPLTAKAGDALKFVGRFHTYSVGPAERIWGGGTLTNPGKSGRDFSYGVAFFDDAGRLVGAADFALAGGMRVDPGETFPLQTPIAVPKGLARSVASFSVALYESTKGFPIR